MPNISSLTMPDGIVYSIKDSIARKEIEEIKKNDSAGSGGSSGGGGVFFINGTYNSGSSTNGTVDKTDADIVDAVNSGKAVYLRVAHGGAGIAIAYRLSAFSTIESGEATICMFIFSVANSGAIEMFTVSNGEFEYRKAEL